jgi:hypothetical protein
MQPRVEGMTCFTDFTFFSTTLQLYLFKQQEVGAGVLGQTWSFALLWRTRPSRDIISPLSMFLRQTAV